MKFLSRLMILLTLLSGINPLFANEEIPLNTSSFSKIDLLKVYEGCPIIYIFLLFLSFAAFVIWLYTLFTLRLNDMMPKVFLSNIRQLVLEKQYESALSVCQTEKNFFSNVIASGLSARKHGHQVIMDAMQAEGRRSGNSLWQRISILNEISTIAPMLGLLGTVIGLFFAFYDNDRSAESIASIFDGLGVAVGTTVAGLIVAISAMIFYTSLKFRLVNLLNTIENESLSLVYLIESE